jgi:hypothetical protein
VRGDISHRLSCSTCPKHPEVSVSEGRLRPELVDLFVAGHAGHSVVQEVSELLPGELSR